MNRTVVATSITLSPKPDDEDLKDVDPWTYLERVYDENMFMEKWVIYPDEKKEKALRLNITEEMLVKVDTLDIMEWAINRAKKAWDRKDKDEVNAYLGLIIFLKEEYFGSE